MKNQLLPPKSLFQFSLICFHYDAGFQLNIEKAVYFQELISIK